MDVICTAGHVDHGKSALVRALTGMEPDRFAEERERGLTIDLGFAWADLPSGRTVAFVDLPGHERFVGNMLAGAGPLGFTLFVVAADEGWMPQSQEHLDILTLLGVHGGVVALTKSDAVDDSTVALARELVDEQLATSPLAGAPIVAVSAATGAGIGDLVEALEQTLAAAAAPVDRSRPRLWVDRSFSVRGAGTVVTGTLAGGELRTGEEVSVLPSEAGSRIRGLQSLGTAVDVAGPGSRVAVNLAAVPTEAIARGDAICLPGQWLVVEAFDAWLRPLPGRRVGRRGAWHLHAGSAERSATIHPVSGERWLVEDGPVRIELDGALPLAAGDRFVVRDAGRRATVAGGVILDPDPPPRPRGSTARRRRADQLAARRTALEAGDQQALLESHVAERGAAAVTRTRAALALDVDATGLVHLGDSYADPAAVERWQQGVLRALHAYHTAHPLARAAPKDAAVTAAVAAACPPAVAPALVELLVERGTVVAEVAGVRVPTHRVELDREQATAREALLAALGSRPFAPPPLGEAAAAAKAPPALLRELETAGDIVRLAPDLAMPASAIDAAVARLRTAYLDEGPLTAARAKQVLGTSRKYALPLLEELDRRGRTRRRGDVRDVLG